MASPAGRNATKPNQAVLQATSCRSHHPGADLADPRIRLRSGRILLRSCSSASIPELVGLYGRKEKRRPRIDTWAEDGRGIRSSESGVERIGCRSGRCYRTPSSDALPFLAIPWSTPRRSTGLTHTADPLHPNGPNPNATCDAKQTTPTTCEPKRQIQRDKNRKQIPRPNLCWIPRPTVQRRAVLRNSRDAIRCSRRRVIRLSYASSFSTAPSHFSNTQRLNIPT
jgi:hypothetical protein